MSGSGGRSNLSLEQERSLFSRPKSSHPKLSFGLKLAKSDKEALRFPFTSLYIDIADAFISLSFSSM